MSSVRLSETNIHPAPVASNASVNSVPSSSPLAVAGPTCVAVQGSPANPVSGSAASEDSKHSTSRLGRLVSGTMGSDDVVKQIYLMSGNLELRALFNVSKASRRLILKDIYAQHNLLFLLLPIELYYSPQYRTSVGFVNLMSRLFMMGIHQDGVNFLNALNDLPFDGSGSEFKLLTGIRKHAFFQHRYSKIERFNVMAVVSPNEAIEEKVPHDELAYILKAKVNNYLSRMELLESLAGSLSVEELKQAQYIYVKHFIIPILERLLPLKGALVNSGKISLRTKSSALPAVDCFINRLFIKAGALIAKMPVSTPDAIAMRNRLNQRVTNLNTQNEGYDQIMTSYNNVSVDAALRMRH